MSAAIRKLEQLLARVQSRRSEPRTRVRSPEAMPVHVAAQHASHVEPQHVEPLPLRPEMMRVPPPAAATPHLHEALRDVAQTSLERASRPVPMTPLENAMGQLGEAAPLDHSPTPVGKIPQAKAPSGHDLALDEFDDGPPTIRPPDSFEAPPMRQPTKVDAPRVEAPRGESPRFEARAAPSKIEEEKPTRVAPALPEEPPARVEPVKPVRVATAEPVVASPVSTISTGRAFVPKTFAQLVERSLALRPRR